MMFKARGRDAVVAVSTIVCALLGGPALAAMLDDLPTRTITLEEGWHAGVDDDVLFGLLVGVDFDNEGNVYVLDSQQCEVSVFDRQGDLLRRLFGEGDGPGEVRRPVSLMVMDDGSVGVVEEFPGYLVVVDALGNFVSKTAVQTSTGEFVSLAVCMSSGPHVVLGGTSFIESTSSSYTRRTSFLGHLGAEGRVEDFDFQQDTSVNYANIKLEETKHIPLFWFASALSADGTLYSVPDYEALSLDRKPLGGEPAVRVAELATSLTKRGKEEKDWWTAALTGMLANAGVPFSVAVSDIEPLVPNISRSVQIDAHGRIWVMENPALRPEEDGLMASYLVIGTSGTVESRVRFVAPHSGRTVGIFFDGDGHVVVAETYRSAMFGANGTGGLVDLGEDDSDEVMPVVYYYHAGENVF